MAGSQTKLSLPANITNEGFKARLNEVVTSKSGMPSGALSDGKHANEAIGYVAVSA